MLAGANLARMRRQYDDAASKCLEVLRRHPKNPAAHSLLGDIYRDQGMTRDAIEWYKLALELDPTSRADREKLDQLIDQVYAADLGPRPGPGPLRRLVTRICAASGCAELTRPVRLTMAATVGLLVVLFISLLAYRYSLTPSAGAPAEESPGGQALQPVPPVPPPPGPEPAAPIPQGPGAPSPAVAPTPSPDQPPPAPGAYGTGLAAREKRLLVRLRASAIKGERPGAIDAVMIDPRNQGAVVDFRAPEQATPTSTKRNLILIALNLSQAVHQADPALALVTTRGALPIPDEHGRKTPEYAFVGEISVRRLPSLDAPPIPPDQALGLFDNVWWHPLYRDLVP